MNEKILEQILEELKSMNKRIDSIEEEVKSTKDTQKLMQTQLTETNQIVRAIRDRQDETDAKLDALAIDVHKLHGELNFVKEEISDIKATVDFTYQKTSQNELEIFKLKRD